MKFSKQVFCLVFALVGCLAMPSYEAVHAAGSCDSSLEDQDGKEAAAVPQKPNDVKITMKQLAKADTSNPIVAHPFLAMTAPQKYHWVLSKFPARWVPEPMFRVRKVPIYPAFVGEVVPLPGIVGQYSALESLAQHIGSAARGEKGGKILGLIGPAGTGKTETLTVLDEVVNGLGKTDADFFEYTFEWLKLHEVEYLLPLLGRGPAAKRPLAPDMPRSPFTLLRPDIQEEVLAAVSPLVSERVGFPLNAWTTPAPKDAQIIFEIMQKAYPDKVQHPDDIADLTKAEYMKVIDKHVRVVPRRIPPTAGLIRFLGDNPDLSKVFVAQNPVHAINYQNHEALAWQFTGKVLQQDGRALAFDEAYRNEIGVLNTMLEIAQNQVVEADGPAVEVDGVFLIAANDESVDSASEDGDMKAMIDRSHNVPMRLNGHPHEISKLAILMLGAKNFTMRPLKEVSGEVDVPFKYDAAYPVPDSNGNLLGVHRRYAISYKPPGATSSILISPYTLEMLGLTAAITRMVNDPNKLKPFQREMDELGPKHDFYKNLVRRLKLYLGKETASLSVRADLEKLHQLLREGEAGISSRDVQSWLKTALDLAIETGQGVLTPEVLDRALHKLLDEGTIQVPGNAMRTAWLSRYSLIRTEFLLPAIKRDMQEIISGQGRRAEMVYDTIVGEIIALQENPEAKEWSPDNGASPNVINHDRLRKITKKYAEIHGRAFNPGFIMRQLADAHKGARNPELLSAIEAYLTETQVEIEGADQLRNYYRGQLDDPAIAKKAVEVEGRAALYGYDEASFKAGLALYHKLLAEKMRSKSGQ